MGSEMCIRDRANPAVGRRVDDALVGEGGDIDGEEAAERVDGPAAVSYTHLTLPTSDLV